MRVLMLVSEAPPIKSGIARVADKLTSGLKSRGIQVDVISANEIPRWSFKEFRFSSLGLRWRGIARNLDSYDIIHVHGTVPTFSDIALLFSRFANRRSGSGTSGPAIVYTHHSDIDIAGLDFPVRIYNSLHQKLLRLADHAVASTPTYALQLEGALGPGRTSAVGFGVNAAQFNAHTTKRDPFNVLFVGQLRPYKGVDVLLKAWKQMSNAELHIVGEGHERENLKALAVELGLQSVYFHGSVSEAQLTEFYARAHTLVLPSKRKAEAFGLVLLEGMAAGCVPVASDLPGVSDVVSTSGFTFPVGDSNALAAILKNLRDDRRERQKLSVLASARALATDWDATIEAYVGVFKQVYLGRVLEAELKKTTPSNEVKPFQFKTRNSKFITPSEGALENWLQEIVEVTQAERASLMLLSPNRRDLHIAASVGIRPDVVAETSVPVGQRMAGFAAQTQKSILVKQRNMPAIARLYKSNPELTSALILPVHYRGRAIGVLNLARGHDRVAFTRADQLWLERLALQVAPLLAQESVLEFTPARKTGRGTPSPSWVLTTPQPASMMHDAAR
ncbi:MAG TPA: glycosyltransferase [Chloroflexia bacterium]|nr:glycosyltransferase [Chloroflexia bacterium]